MYKYGFLFIVQSIYLIYDGIDAVLGKSVLYDKSLTLRFRH